MFETSVVRDRAIAGRRYGLVVMSLAGHTLVVGAIVTASISVVRFPTRAPREFAVFNPMPVIEIPAPLGNPAAPRTTAAAHPSATSPPAATPPQETPPNVIPSTVSPAPGSAPMQGDTTAVGPASQLWGAPDGRPEGIDVGQPGVRDPVPAVGITYQPGGDVQRAVVLKRVEPLFPRAALAGRITGIVVLRCIIDRSGEIRDAQVVSSTFEGFDRPALDAFRQWRFAPGSMRGQTVDTWFELTIRFEPR